MVKKRPSVPRKLALSIAVLWASCASTLAQQTKEEKKPQSDASAASQTTAPRPETKKEEYDEVLSPFGMQRLPRKAGGSPFQQPTVPPAKAATAPPAATAVPSPAQTPSSGATPAQAPMKPAGAALPSTGTGMPVAAPVPPPQSAAQAAADSGPSVGFVCVNCDLLEFIRNVGTELKLNYIIDPKVKGVVTIHTYGELKREDLLPVLETVLRINGAAMAKTGNFYQIVLAAGVRGLPLEIRKPGQEGELSKSDSKVLQIVPMRFVGAADMVKILEPYLSEGGHVGYHAQGNILMITENSANLRKLMELIELFDTDVFQNKRVQLHQVKYNRAKDLLPDLDRVFSAYALSSKDSAIKFIAIERLNGILAVAPNPSVTSEIERWIARLDQPVQTLGIRNFVYKVENSEAKKLEPILLRLYGQQPGSLFVPQGPAASPMPGASPVPPPAASSSVSEPGKDMAAGQVHGEIKIVADEINNALIIRSSPQDYEVVKETIRQLDVVPRQVLIDVKIFEVVLTGNLSMGVSAFLQQRASGAKITTASFSAATAGALPAGLNFGTFAKVGMTRELVAFLNAQETRSRSRVLSAPSVIASDNVEAHIQVGQEVPILTAQGIVPGGTGGGSLFTNSVQNRSTGIILNVTPRINPNGWVTLKVHQEVSSPGPPPDGSAIQSPAINIRSVATQLTVKDGETIAIGGIISETKGLTKNRVPLLGDIPGVGLLFGNSSYVNNRTELIALITPRLIEDIDQAHDLTEELKGQLRSLRKDLRRSERSHSN
ncbi:MAG: type II secretion system protein GspD [Acidimicrobiia bacterium]|nr:type II secretion system protein GspD [Acidimicrobiia bacterium]